MVYSSETGATGRHSRKGEKLSKDYDFPTWADCPTCGEEPHVIQPDAPGGTLMGCACGWFGRFSECWRNNDAVRESQAETPLFRK